MYAMHTIGEIYYSLEPLELSQLKTIFSTIKKLFY